MDNIFRYLTRNDELETQLEQEGVWSLPDQRQRHILFNILRKDKPPMHFIDFFLRDWYTYAEDTNQSTPKYKSQNARQTFFKEVELLLNKFGYKNTLKNQNVSDKRIWMLCVFVTMNHDSIHPDLRQRNQNNKVNAKNILKYFRENEIAQKSIPCKNYINTDLFKDKKNNALAQDAGLFRPKNQKPNLNTIPEEEEKEDLKKAKEGLDENLKKGMSDMIAQLRERHQQIEEEAKERQKPGAPALGGAAIQSKVGEVIQENKQKLEKLPTLMRPNF